MTQRINPTRYSGLLIIGERVSYRIYDLVLRNSLSYEIQITPIFISQLWKYILKYFSLIYLGLKLLCQAPNLTYENFV